MQREVSQDTAMPATNYTVADAAQLSDISRLYRTFPELTEAELQEAYREEFKISVRKQARPVFTRRLRREIRSIAGCREAWDRQCEGRSSDIGIASSCSNHIPKMSLTSSTQAPLVGPYCDKGKHTAGIPEKPSCTKFSQQYSKAERNPAETARRPVVEYSQIATQPGSIRTRLGEHRLSITTAQVDQLVTALANSALIQRHVRGQYWNWDANARRALSKALRQEHAPGESCLDVDKPSRLPCLLPTSAERLALVDANVAGRHVRHVPRNSEAVSESLKAGDCTLLNVDYGTAKSSNLRIEPPTSTTSYHSIRQHAINAASATGTDKKASYLIAEVDVTIAFTEAALNELAICVGVSLDQISIIDMPFSPFHDVDDGHVDWCAVADELQIEGESNDTVEGVVRHIEKLDTRTCTTQTRALLSGILRTRSAYGHFMGFEPEIHHERGDVLRMKVLYIPEMLPFALDGQSSERANHVNSESTEVFRPHVAHAICSTANVDHKSEMIFKREDLITCLRCVYMCQDDEEKDEAWCVFVKYES